MRLCPAPFGFQHLPPPGFYRTDLSGRPYSISLPYFSESYLSQPKGCFTKGNFASG